VLGDEELAAELGRGPIDTVDHVLYAPSGIGSPIDVAAAYRLFGEARRIVTELTALSAPPKLFFLTRNAQPVTDGDRANPVHAVLWGLGRTLALEHPEIWGGCIDIDESMPAVPAARQVRREAAGGDGEDQVVYRSGVRHVPRLEPTAATGSDSTGSRWFGFGFAISASRWKLRPSMTEGRKRKSPERVPGLNFLGVR
jgi:phthiocerol/phenolphthiocerol synthesis type-I polyketide synthase B